MKNAKDFKEAMKNGLAEEFKAFAADRKPKNGEDAAALITEFAKLHGYDVSASAADASKNKHILCDDQLSMAAGGRNGVVSAIAGADGPVNITLSADNKNTNSVFNADNKNTISVFNAGETNPIAILGCD